MTQDMCVPRKKAGPSHSANSSPAHTPVLFSMVSICHSVVLYSCPEGLHIFEKPLPETGGLFGRWRKPLAGFGGNSWKACSHDLGWLQFLKVPPSSHAFLLLVARNESHSGKQMWHRWWEFPRASGLYGRSRELDFLGCRLKGKSVISTIFPLVRVKREAWEIVKWWLYAQKCMVKASCRFPIRISGLWIDGVWEIFTCGWRCRYVKHLSPVTANTLHQERPTRVRNFIEMMSFNNTVTSIC